MKNVLFTNCTYVNIRGFKVRCLIKGEGKDLVLIHGLGGSIESWRYNIDYLSSKGFRVVAPDLIGFGLSEKPRINYTLDLFVEQIRELIASLNLKEVNLVGHSLGGLVSLSLTLKHPEVIDKLVIENSAGLERKSREIIEKFMGDWWTKDKLKKFYEYIGHDPSRISDEILELRMKMYEKDEAKYAYKSTLNMSFNCEEFKRGLEKIDKPTMIIWGAKDRLIPVRYAYEFNKLIKRSKLVVIQNAGHTPHAEAYEIYNKLIDKFLR